MDFSQWLVLHGKMRFEVKMNIKKILDRIYGMDVNDMDSTEIIVNTLLLPVNALLFIYFKVTLWFKTNK